VAESGAALALGRYVRTIVDKVPSVEVVDITIPVVIDPRFALGLRLIGPELVTQVLVIDVSAIIENSDYDGLDRPVVTPGE
jgi:hypothetical protein